MKRILFLYVLPFFVLIATVAVVWIYNKPHRTVTDDEAAFRISASQLVDEFSADEEGTSDKYVGKVLEVNGLVRELFREGNTVVVVLGDQDQPAGVSFSLQEDEVADTELKEGAQVTMKGICNGMLFDVVMDKAVLLESRSSANER